MENASKALIITGSILVVILLIGMGLKTIDNTSPTVDQVQGTMNQTEIVTFNSKFTRFIGNGKSAAQVKALADEIIASNATNSLHKIKINGSDVASVIIQGVANLSESTSYNIKITNYDTNGYITDITY